ncbi:hypothetical protein LOAG_03104 [Loa loa]|uniref:Uncharacterized protein n=1 Tax=Loa loa TaxID=7209 RepID=A0A1S0U594_LOALO|nr:hypothetical protein LOAG_03104 [Loa loa]EFO25391.2 hypothetical protein LOAG_03104 [Loa loa]
MTDSMPVQNEIDELEKRLVKMDFKLETAKKARDEYVNFLRQKYPSWKPHEMQIYNQSSISSHFERSILEKMATNKYHWDLGGHFIAPRSKPELDNQLEPNDPIPSSGPALEPDLVRIKKRLGEIAEDLDNLREHRLHLSTADYYLSLGPESRSCKSQEMPWRKNIVQLKSLHELRKQISQIDCVVLDTPRPDAEWMRVEYLQKYTNSEAGKRNDNQSEGKSEQSFTDKGKNLSMLPTEQQKESSYLQEAQYTGTNLTLKETPDLRQTLDVQRGDQKSSSQEIVAVKSRFFRLCVSKIL